MKFFILFGLILKEILTYTLKIKFCAGSYFTRISYLTGVLHRPLLEPLLIREN